MNDASHKIIILDGSGNPAGFKLRKDIDRRTDILYAVHVEVFTSEKQIILSVISENAALPKLYPGKLGSAVATFMREGEDTLQAARRALEDELFLTHQELIFLGESFDDLNGVKRKQAVYYVELAVAEVKYHPEKMDGVRMFGRDELTEKISGEIETFAPTFISIFGRFQHKLPFS